MDIANSLCNHRGMRREVDDTVVEVWFVPSDGRPAQLWKPASVYEPEARNFCERVGVRMGAGRLDCRVVA